VFSRVAPCKQLSKALISILDHPQEKLKHMRYNFMRQLLCYHLHELGPLTESQRHVLPHIDIKVNSVYFLKMTMKYRRASARSCTCHSKRDDSLAYRTSWLASTASYRSARLWRVAGGLDIVISWSCRRRFRTGYLDKIPPESIKTPLHQL
jgi:hypothetical protein